jgi:acetolactate decarboxylase
VPLQLDGYDAGRATVLTDGGFRSMRTRSVSRQSKPYPPLVDVTQDQPVCDLNDASGTLVGFRFPEFAKGMNVPGYHFRVIA